MAGVQQVSREGEWLKDRTLLVNWDSMEEIQVKASYQQKLWVAMSVLRYYYLLASMEMLIVWLPCQYLLLCFECFPAQDANAAFDRASS